MNTDEAMEKIKQLYKHYQEFTTDDKLYTFDEFVKEMYEITKDMI